MPVSKSSLWHLICDICGAEGWLESNGGDARTEARKCQWTWRGKEARCPKCRKRHTIGRKREVEGEILRMRGEGMTFAQIGDAMGLSRQRVHVIYVRSQHEHRQPEVPSASIS